jgi:hypothetical protein
MPRLLAILLSVVVFLASTAGEARAFFGSKENARNEIIIVSGGPALQTWENLRRKVDQHDQWWGNFIRSAKFRMAEIVKEKGPSANITWMVYRPAYERRATEQGVPLLQYIESVRDDYFARDLKHPIRLVWFDSGDDVINYVNSGQNRRSVKVGGFEYFGHSNMYAFMFDYSNHISGACRAWLHQDDLKRMKRSAFAKGAFCKSWGCHTGESMSAVWRSSTGTRMWGAKGKTDYSPLKFDKLPEITDGGYWKH